MNRKKLFTCLTALGIKPTMESFNDRKRMQKVSYWLPIFEIDVGLSKNDFNWYLHGPYSPQLTRALFEIVENTNENSIVTLTTKEEEQIERLKQFLGEDIKSTDSLELLVSLYYLLQIAKDQKLPSSVVIEVLKEKKPYFKDREIHKALRKLQAISA